MIEQEEGRPAKAPLLNADASQRQVPQKRTTASRQDVQVPGAPPRYPLPADGWPLPAACNFATHPSQNYGCTCTILPEAIAAYGDYSPGDGNIEEIMAAVSNGRKLCPGCQAWKDFTLCPSCFHPDMTGFLEAARELDAAMAVARAPRPAAEQQAALKLADQALMAPICPNHAPHPQWPHLCNCADCTAAARLVDLSGMSFELGDLDNLLNPGRTHPGFDRTYLRSAAFRMIVHADELPRKDPLHGWPVRLRWDAEPPADKFEFLAMIEPRFERSYRRRRPDLLDQSDSSCDYSLAQHAFAAAWTCQEVANLLIAGRREHGDISKPGKALRRDYMERTLLKALLQVARRSL